MKELWKDMPGLENNYAISNKGNVVRKERTYTRYDGHIVRLKQKPMSVFKIKSGFITNIVINGKHSSINISKKMALAFMPKPGGKLTIGYKDGNQYNININNLEWITRSESRKRLSNVPKVMYKPRRQPRRVAQYDMSGRLLKVWKNGMVIERELGISLANISRVCNGIRQHASYFKWKYIEENDSAKIRID